MSALVEANLRLQFLGKIGRDITASLDLDDLMLAVHTAIDSLLPTDSLGVGVYDEERQRIEYKFFLEQGKRAEPIIVDMSNPRSLGVWCIRERSEILIADAETEYRRYLPQRPQFAGGRNRSIVYFPLIVKERIIGFLTVQSRLPAAYSENDIETLRILASYVAVALENSLIIERVIQLNQELKIEKLELERASRIIEHMANHDSLTGLPNRRLLNEVIAKYIPLAQRQQRLFAVVFIDLDEFKPINDTFGHAAGDAVLRAVGARLNASMRASDVVARVGGDEFVVVIRDIEHFEQAAVVVEKAMSSIPQPIDVEGRQITPVASAGVSLFPYDGTSFEELLQRADETMYRVKNAGGPTRWAFRSSESPHGYGYHR